MEEKRVCYIVLMGLIGSLVVVEMVYAMRGDEHLVPEDKGMCRGEKDISQGGEWTALRTAVAEGNEGVCVCGLSVMRLSIM